ncbi:MAG: SCO family protein [Burkholderiales bacterium]
MNRFIFALVFTLVGCGSAIADDASPVVNVKLNPDAWPIEPFSLTDHLGQSFSEARLHGQWTFVVFGNTQCAERCGAAMTALAEVRDRMGNAQAGDNTQVLFISVDPERDTPERLRHYVTRFNKTFIGASGPRTTLAQLSTTMNSSDQSTHSKQSEDASIMLVSPDGFPKAQFFPPYDAAALTSEYLRIRLCRGQSR